MSLRDYLKIFRQRWWAIVACGLLAGVVVFVITPANASDQAPATSYTATATLLVGEVEGGGGGAVPLNRIALLVTTGEVPVRAAERLGYEGDPAVLATSVVVGIDQSALALTIASTNSNGKDAAERANTFAQVTVEYFEEMGDTRLTILQSATPIANTSGGAVLPPNRELRAGLAALIGLLMGLGLAIVLDHLDARLQTRDEIGDATGLPVIAEIPKLSRADRKAGAIVVDESPLSIYADGYRAARTALLHAPARPVQPPAPTRAAGAGGTFGPWEPDDSYETAPALNNAAAGSVIMITSALAGEGKTTSAANIAASFAETGKRVLVIDADLRSPNLHELFDVPQGAGVSDYLTQPQALSLPALVRPTRVPGVGILTAGTLLTNPASLTSRMEPLLQAARKVADIVVVDSSPILGASDGFDIIPLVDSVLLVVRSGRLTGVTAQRMAELMKRFQAPVAGVVVLAVPARASDGYGYGYGYGDGYGAKKGDRNRRAHQATTADDDQAGTVVPLDSVSSQQSEQLQAPPAAESAGADETPRAHNRNPRRAIGRSQGA